LNWRLQFFECLIYIQQDMSINCISPKHRVVTLDYSGSSLATNTNNIKKRCNSSDSNSDIPGMVPSVSTQSCSSEVSETDSISTRDRRQGGAQSPRSIFQRFWTSPTHTKSLEQSVDEDEEILERLSKLQLPSANEIGECSTSPTTAKVIYPTRHTMCSTSAAVEDVVDPKASRITRKTSIDDMSIGYQAVTTPPASTRRQILPTPPPQQLKPYNSPTQSKQDQLSHNVVSRGGGGDRNWSSTGELPSRRPSQSCLRKTRYSSCNAIDDAELLRQLHEEDQKGMPLKKSRSVSFYSEVSVFEFNVVKDEIKSQEGWSKYFA